MEKNLVSVIMPSYNTAEYILESVKCVLDQSYENIELIVVDDCSTDNTLQQLDTIKDSRLIVISNSTNVGAAISRNSGILRANGKYIAFLDSDDIWTKDKLKKQIEFMELNNYDFTYTNYSIIDENGILKNISCSGPRKIKKNGYRLYNWAGCLTVIYNSENLGKIQIIDIKKRNDYAIWLKISKKSECFLLNENLAMYRHRSNSLSRVSKFKLVKYHYIIFRKSEGFSIISSILLTICNIICGICRKKIYIKK